MNIKINGCCGEMCFCFRGLNWLFYKITFCVKSLWAYFFKKAHYTMQRANNMIQVLSFFLCYFLTSHSTSAIVLFSFSMSLKLSLKYFFKLFSYYFLIVSVFKIKFMYHHYYIFIR